MGGHEPPAEAAIATAPDAAQAVPHREESRAEEAETPVSLRRRILQGLAPAVEAGRNVATAANNAYDKLTFAATPQFVLTAIPALYEATTGLRERLPHFPGHAATGALTDEQKWETFNHVLMGVKMLGGYALHQALGGAHIPVTPSSGAPDLLLTHHGAGAGAVGTAAEQVPVAAGQHAELMDVRAGDLSSTSLDEAHGAATGGTLEAAGVAPGGVRVLDENALQHVHREWAKAGVPNRDFQFIPGKEGMTLQVAHPTDTILPDGRHVAAAELREAKFLVTVRVQGPDGQFVREAVEIPATIEHDPEHGDMLVTHFPSKIAGLVQADKFSTIEVAIPGHGSDLTVISTVVGAGNPLTPQDASEFISHAQDAYGSPSGDPGSGIPDDSGQQGMPGKQDGGGAGGGRTQSPPASSAPAAPAASSPAGSPHATASASPVASPSHHPTASGTPTAPASPSGGAVPPGGGPESPNHTMEYLAIAGGVPVTAAALAVGGSRVARHVTERRRATHLGTSAPATLLPTAINTPANPQWERYNPSADPGLLEPDPDDEEDDADGASGQTARPSRTTPPAKRFADTAAGNSRPAPPRGRPSWSRVPRPQAEDEALLPGYGAAPLRRPSEPAAEPGPEPAPTAEPAATPAPTADTVYPPGPVFSDGSRISASGKRIRPLRYAHGQPDRRYTSEGSEINPDPHLAGSLAALTDGEVDAALHIANSQQQSPRPQPPAASSRVRRLFFSDWPRLK